MTTKEDHQKAHVKALLKLQDFPAAGRVSGEPDVLLPCASSRLGSRDSRPAFCD
ncbi:MAG: hypothetical protein M2R45_04126 [Verrucomicrobia subdivision 3 bacterium]|nr:hypothetical protein [Limisphaerales bacterium]